ncbi:hypothetical protein evm_010646 [Chilo suppressalis]|nr:hypothetical protein evm_010646 [Chilo suppressalis]
MSESKWSTDKTFKFIELYQNEPAIWNSKNRHHKEKSVVNDAWKRIEDAMSIPVPELKKKKETLMSAFRLNHKKVITSIKSGAAEEEIFKPIWIYYDALAAFMSDIYECKSILTTENEESSENEESNSDENLLVKIPIQKRRRQKPVELQETQMNTTLTTLNNMLNNTKHKNDSRDDCDLYGMLLAKKLRSYPEIERQEIMYEIDGLLLKKRKRGYQIKNKTVIGSSSKYAIKSRPSSTNSSINYSASPSPTPPEQSIDSINSPSEVLIIQSPSQFL